MPVLITAGCYPEAYRLQRVLSLQDVFFADDQELPFMPGIQSMFCHLVLPQALSMKC